MRSARHLDSSGSGKLRRWLPRDIAGCTLYLDADFGVTDAGGGACSSWKDVLTGSGKAVVAAGAQRPTIVSVSTHLGGRKAIAFSGSQWLKGTFSTHTTTCTIFVVAWHNVAVGSTVGYVATTAGGVVNTRTSVFNSGGIYLRRDGSVDTVGADVATAAIVATAASSAGVQYVNSRTATQTSAVAATLAADDTVIVGALSDASTFAMGGEIALVGVWNRVLVAAEIARLAVYARRYGLSIA